MQPNLRCNKPFYAVQFIELPSEDIDDYVCVPLKWIVAYKESEHKAAVAYPQGEDPFDTRDRAKRSEMPHEDWKSYMAEVKYESNTYGDAEFWIATRNDYGPIIEENSKKDIQITLPSFTLNKKGLRNPGLPIPRNCVKRPALDNIMEVLPKKRSGLSEATRPTNAANNHAILKPGCSKRDESTCNRDNHLESAQSEEIAASSSSGVSMEVEHSIAN